MGLVDDVLGRILDDPRGTVLVRGATGAGKSAMARSVTAEANAASTRQAILLSPPSQAPDAPALALASLGRHLGAKLQPQLGWAPGVRTTVELLNDRAHEVILVLDEPSRWAASAGPFVDRATELLEVLGGASSRWPTIIVDQQGRGDHTIDLPAVTVTDLLNEAEWGKFADSADAVARSDAGQQLLTPLNQRLAIALVAWGHEAGGLPIETSELSLRLAETLVEKRHGPELWGVWQRLALARTELSPSGLAALGADQLGELGAGTLELALLDGAGRLHDSLRRIPSERPVDPELQRQAVADAHDRLFEHHLASLNALGEVDGPVAAEHAGEALYHAAELGDLERIDLLPIDLTDQLDALAMVLADRRADYRGASSIFLRALQLDQSDAVAQHGRARTLDVLGEQFDEVQSGYGRALDIDPLNPDWHAHQILLFLDRGLLDLARRAWAQAESALESPSPVIFDRLHLQVATALIAHAELDFAKYVLDGVPPSARDVEHERLARLLRGRLAADDQGAFVPAPRSGGSWWLEPPRELTPRDSEGRDLAEWGAGRVEEVDAASIHLHIAMVREGAEPSPGRMTISAEQWENLCLDAIPLDAISAGRFVEIGWYRSTEGEAVTVLRLIPRMCPTQCVTHRFRRLAGSAKGTNGIAHRRTTRA